MKELLFAGLFAAFSVAGNDAGICETLARRSPDPSKPIVVEIEASLGGSDYHSYKLFQDIAGHLCPQSSIDLPLRPVLAFCGETTEGCPGVQTGSKQGWAALRYQIDELRKQQASGKPAVLRLRIRGTLIRKPGTKIVCDDDTCWGSGFGDGSVAAALAPLSVRRVP